MSCKLNLSADGKGWRAPIQIFYSLTSHSCQYQSCQSRRKMVPTAIISVCLLFLFSVSKALRLSRNSLISSLVVDVTENGAGHFVRVFSFFFYERRSVYYFMFLFVSLRLSLCLSLSLYQSSKQESSYPQRVKRKTKNRVPD